MMKNLTRFLFLTLLLAGNPLYGQEKEKQDSTDQKREYLCGGTEEVAPFGGPLMNFNLLEGNLGHSFGGAGGLMFDSGFFIGGYGMGGSSWINSKRYPEQNIDISIGHGGIWTGYHYRPDSPIHPILSLRGGWGSAEGKIEEFSPEGDLVVFNAQDLFFIEPEGGITFNFNKQIRLVLMGGYRFISGFQGAKQERISSNDLNGFQGTVNIQFGGF